MSQPESIIITLDGDDWFPHENVLTRVNKEYIEHDCWMTYGTYVEHPYRDISRHYHEYPLDIRTKKQFRSHRWLASHLRTFRRELFLKIKIVDFKDPLTHEFVSVCGDLAFQFPMLEMCGTYKSRYLSDILYVYNRENPLSESKIFMEQIKITEAMLRSKTPYETLENLYSHA